MNMQRTPEPENSSNISENEVAELLRQHNYPRIQNGLRMYLLVQKYKHDEHLLNQLLHLLNPPCYFLQSLKIDVATSHTGARFCSYPQELLYQIPVQLLSLP